MNVSDKVKRKLAKLHALAERGEGGEKDNAERVLAKLLAQHNLTIADLDDEAQSEVRFYFNSEYEKRLLGQVMATVLNNPERNVYKIKKRRQFMAEMTASEKLEAELQYSIYKLALKKLMEQTFMAFISTNDIFPTNSAEGEGKQYSEDEIATIRRLMRGIDLTEVNPALEHTA